MEAIFDTWHPSWKDLPWKPLSNPVDRFQVPLIHNLQNFNYRLIMQLLQVLPSFVLGEFMFITAAILLFIHALRNVRFEFNVHEKNRCCHATFFFTFLGKSVCHVMVIKFSDGNSQ